MSTVSKESRTESIARAQRLLAAGAREQVHLRAGELDVGREQPDAAGVDDRVFGLHPLQQHVVQRGRALLGLESEREREAGLRVEVDEEHPLAEVGERQAQGLGRRGLGDAAFLVGDREHPRHGRGVYGAAASDRSEASTAGAVAPGGPIRHQTRGPAAYPVRPCPLCDIAGTMA